MSPTSWLTRAHIDEAVKTIALSPPKSMQNEKGRRWLGKKRREGQEVSCNITGSIGIRRNRVVKVQIQHLRRH